MSAQLAKIPTTELAMMPPTDRARALLKSDTLTPKLTALVAESTHIVAITNADGYKQAHAKRMVLKNERVALEKDGKGLRDDANAFAKAIIAEEKRLIAIVSPEEDRLEALQTAWDAAIEAEKQAKARAIREEAEALAARIRAIQDVPANVAGKSCAEIAAAVREVEAIDLESFPEAARQTAQNARDAALARLATMYADRKGFEEEQARVQAERELLDRQRQEQEAESARLAKIAEDERAELQSIADIVLACAGLDSTWITRAIENLRSDPPVNPTPAVAAAYTQALEKLASMAEQAAAAEAKLEAENAERLARQQREDKERADRIEREDAERRETARTEDHKRRIADIESIQRQAIGRTSEAILVLIDEVQATPCDFDEFTSQALDAVANTTAELRLLHSAAVDRETKDAEFRAQVAADQQRKAKEAADRRAAEDKAARDAAELERAETQRLIAECTLLQASEAALLLLRETGHGESLAALMLASAIGREALRAAA